MARSRVGPAEPDRRKASCSAASRLAGFAPGQRMPAPSTPASKRPPERGGPCRSGLSGDPFEGEPAPSTWARWNPAARRPREAFGQISCQKHAELSLRAQHTGPPIGIGRQALRIKAMGRNIHAFSGGTLGRRREWLGAAAFGFRSPRSNGGLGWGGWRARPQQVHDRDTGAGRANRRFPIFFLSGGRQSPWKSDRPFEGPMRAFEPVGRAKATRPRPRSRGPFRGARRRGGGGDGGEHRRRRSRSRAVSQVRAKRCTAALLGGRRQSCGPPGGGATLGFYEVFGK